ncbi:MAG: integrase core domain-containing protein [Nitrospirales bacterium]
MDWARVLASITGTVDEELLIRNEYLVAENRILRAQIKGRLRLTDPERATLGEIAHRVGRTALEEVAHAVMPDTLLGWYRRLIARKFDGSRGRRTVGRPRMGVALEQLVVRLAQENRDWGYDRIVGAVANLGYVISDQTVANILARQGIPPAPERKSATRWSEFIRRHIAVLVGTDFLSVEVLTLRGLVTYYVFFFIHRESRRVAIAGITPHPNERWMVQMAKNVTMEEWGFLQHGRYLLHDRDAKYTESFRAMVRSGRVRPLTLPARSPNLNAYAERWVKSVKDKCLSKLIFVGEASLRRALRQYLAHYHEERNHQGKGTVLLVPEPLETNHTKPIRCRERLGGLFHYYYRAAA